MGRGCVGLVSSISVKRTYKHLKADINKTTVKAHYVHSQVERDKDKVFM